MKNLIVAIVIMIIGLAVVAELRYVLIVDSPVVTKFDRLTGDAWIVNGGVWRKVQSPPAEKAEPQKTAVTPQSAAKTK